jgi:hypothetical protein
MCIAALGLLVACGSPSSDSPAAGAPSTASPTATDANRSAPSASTAEADIVVAAAIARLTMDNSFGGTVVFDRVNIVDRYGAERGAGFLEVHAGSAVIGTDVRTAIEHGLAPTVVAWVGDLADVVGTGPEIPSYEEVGAVLTLGSPNVDGSRATITTGLWCGSLCGIGGEYTVEWTESQGWQITGTDGPQWIA